MVNASHYGAAAPHEYGQGGHEPVQFRAGEQRYPREQSYPYPPTRSTLRDSSFEEPVFPRRGVPWTPPPPSSLTDAQDCCCCHCACLDDDAAGGGGCCGATTTPEVRTCQCPPCKPGQPFRHFVDPYCPGISEDLDEHGCCCAQQDCSSCQGCLCAPVACIFRVFGFGCFCPCEDDSDRMLGCGQAWLLMLGCGLIAGLLLAGSLDVMLAVSVPIAAILVCAVPCV